MTNLNLGTRLATMFLDHIIMTFVIFVFALPIFVVDMMALFNDEASTPAMNSNVIYLTVFGFSLYFNKDIYGGRSIGKRIMKLQVVEANSGKPASELRCFVRNLTIILWPLEIIVSLFSNDRRLGDFIAGTRLTPYDEEAHRSNQNGLQIALALALALLYTYLVTVFPINLISGQDVFSF